MSRLNRTVNGRTRRPPAPSGNALENHHRRRRKRHRLVRKSLRRGPLLQGGLSALSQPAAKPGVAAQQVAVTWRDKDEDEQDEARENVMRGVEKRIAQQVTVGDDHQNGAESYGSLAQPPP